MSGFMMSFLQHLSVTFVPINMTVLVIWSLQIFWLAEFTAKYVRFLQQCWFKLCFYRWQGNFVFWQKNYLQGKTRIDNFRRKCTFVFYCATTIFRGDDGNQAALRYYVTAVRGSGKSLHYLFVTRAVIPASRGGAEEGENAFPSSPLSLSLPPRLAGGVQVSEAAQCTETVSCCN